MIVPNRSELPQPVNQISVGLLSLSLFPKLLFSMSWQLDVSSFLVLLGEEEESNFRLVRRRIWDILAIAPVAGFPTYFWSASKVIEARGPQYISPGYGCHTAPLRNMRVNKMLMTNDLLDDGSFTIHRIKPPGKSAGFASELRKDFWTICLTASTWIVSAVLLTLAMNLQTVTWIGVANLFALLGWSFVLRVIDRFILIPGKHVPSFHDRDDSVIFMGRRNSAAILQGSRADIARWTGIGLRVREGTWSHTLHHFQRIGTVIFLIFVFCTVPNGSTQDQILFIAYNILGQFNTWIGQRLHARRTLQKLDLVSREHVSSRTHVYALLIKQFGDGTWIDAADMMPQTEVWNLWRERIADSDLDPKRLWEACDYQCHLEACQPGKGE